MKDSKQGAFERAKAVFRDRGGLLRTMEALNLGVHPRTLYAMRDAGVLERIDRGLYRLCDMPPLGNPDLATVALTIPKGVICLVSALAYHEITTQIPHQVYVAVKRFSAPPSLRYPPLRVFWFSGRAFTEGIQTNTVDSVLVRVYSPEKTLADCLKYRRKVGLDVFLEALRLYRQRRQPRIDELIHFARICRVEREMRPYLEALL